MAKRKLRLIITLFILVALPAVLLFLDKKIGERRFIANDEAGSQGARPEYDLSDSTPQEFKKAFKYQMLKSAELVHTSAGPGITLGLFLMRDLEGRTVDVCEKYKTVDLVFKAEGVAYSGEIPTLIVRGPCLVASDQRTLEALPIPFKIIRGSPVSIHEFEGEIPGYTQRTKIYVRNVVGFWPADWNWVGVTLYADPREDALQINGYEIISVLGRPLVISAE